MTNKKSQIKSCGSLLAAAALFIFAVIPTFGQTASDPPVASSSPAPSPTHSPETDEVQPEPVNYFFPDLAPDVTKYSSKYFDIRVAFAVLTDYTFIGQDSVSRAQVGPQASRFDLRAGRFGLSGQLKFKRPWTFLIGRDFNENRDDGDRVFDGLDYHLTIRFEKGPPHARKPKNFSYEMVGDAATSSAGALLIHSS